MKPRYILLLPLLAATVGCLTEKRTYQVAVQNKLEKPITVWLVKDHGPTQSGWFSPEEVAKVATPPSEDTPIGLVVPPGKTATRGPVEGSFEKERGRAYLRVYEGQPTLDEMLATDKGSLNRLDVLLKPGANAFVIQNNNGLMSAVKTAIAPPPPDVSK